MFIDVAEHGVAFEKRRKARARARHFKTGVNSVREISGVAEHVAGRHSGRIGGGEGRKQGVAIAQAHAQPRHGGHGWRGVVVHHAKAQPVGDEEDYIVWPRALRLRQSGRG